MKAFYLLLTATAALWHAACFANPPAQALPLHPAIPNSTTLLKDSDAAPDKAAAAAKMVLPGIESPGIKSSKSIRFFGIQPVGPMFRDARNCSPAPGMLGGPAKIKTSPVISGNIVNHKPL